MTGSEPAYRRWAGYAPHYAELVRSYPLFTSIADRLVDLVGEDFSGTALDVAAGTGLVAERLLARHPGARVWLLEPAAEMLALARQRLQGREAGEFEAPAEDWPADVPELDLVLSSASLHFCDEERVFLEVGRRLRPGGRCAFNLWGHSFDELAERQSQDGGRAPLQRALAELGEPAAEWAPSAERRIRSRAGLQRAVAAAGLRVLELCLDADVIDPALDVEFAAMTARLPGLGPERAARVLERARTLAREERPPFPVDSVRFLLERGGA